MAPETPSSIDWETVNQATLEFAWKHVYASIFRENSLGSRLDPFYAWPEKMDYLEPLTTLTPRQERNQ